MTTQSLFHKRDNTKYVKIFPDQLPEKTNILCWWCCHSFDTHPVSMPEKHDPIKDTFVLRGVFCGFSCCKAYALNTQGVSQVAISNIKVLANRMGVPYKQKIICAPQKECLKAFGGYMTIEEFRNKTKDGIAVKSLLNKQYALLKVIQKFL